MSSITLNVADAFPPGTSVSAYPRSNWVGDTRPGGAPVGSSAATATVASDGTLTFASLTDGVVYEAYAQVGGVDKYRRFMPSTPPSSAGSSVVGIDPSLAKYGADPTGAADATAAFQAAYADAVTAGHYTLSPAPGTYTVNGRIHGSSAATTPVRLVAQVPGTVTIQRSAAQCIIEVIGSRGATAALSADAAAGATSVTVAALPTGGLVADDYAELTSNVVLSGTAVTAEVLRVKSVTGSGPYTITFYGTLEEAYATANAAAIGKITHAGVGSVLRGVIFKQTAQNRDNASFPLVRFQLARDVRIDDCTMRDADVPGIELISVVDIDIDRCYVANLTDNLGSNFIGYGVSVAGDSRDVRVSRLRARWVRHAFTTTNNGVDPGVPRHILVTDGQSFESSAGGWNTHKEGKFITFNACESHNDNGPGFYMRAPFTTVIEPLVVNPSANNACIFFGADTGASQASDGRVQGGRLYRNATGFCLHFDAARCTAIGTKVTGPGGTSQNIRIDANATDSMLAGIRSRNPGGSTHVIYVAGNGTNHVVNGGFWNNDSGLKSVVSTAATGQVRFIGTPVGTNLFSIDTFNRARTDDQPVSVTKNGNYTVQDMDGTIVEDATSAAATVTLPAASTIGAGRTFTVIKKDSSANAVTVATGGGTINGAVNDSLTAQYQVGRYRSDGTNYFKV